MKAVFLSDAHLRHEGDRGYRLIIDFLDDIKPGLTHLFSAGDFFDFWFCGEGRLYPAFAEVIEKIIELKNAGVEITLFEGNHDFFMAEFFERLGISVFEGDGRIVLDGKRFFISHGDRVDSSNRGYLFLRRILRSGLFYKFQKALPSRVLWRIAAISSQTSKDYLAKPSEGLVKKMREFALQKFEEGIDAVILGHSHAALLEEYEIQDTRRTFVLLGDWIGHFSYLVYEGGRFKLLKCNASKLMKS